MRRSRSTCRRGCSRGVFRDGAGSRTRSRSYAHERAARGAARDRSREHGAGQRARHPGHAGRRAGGRRARRHPRSSTPRAERILGPLVGPPRRAARRVRAGARPPLRGWREDEQRSRDMPTRAAVDRHDGARASCRSGAAQRGCAVIFLEDLTRIQAEARQMKLAALGRLTANIAHEVRNPLGAISHAAELLQEEPAANDTRERLITHHPDNAQRLDRMVNDVLRLQPQRPRAPRELQAGRLPKTFVEQFCQIEKIDPRDLRDRAATPTATCSFDRSHLNQVMWNLCRNAARHCRRQEGEHTCPSCGFERAGRIGKIGRDRRRAGRAAGRCAASSSSRSSRPRRAAPASVSTSRAKCAKRTARARLRRDARGRAFHGDFAGSRG